VNKESVEMKHVKECNCARIYLEHIRTNQSTCLNQCYLDDCPIVSQFFKDKYLLTNQSNTNNEFVEIVAEPIETDFIDYLINPEKLNNLYEELNVDVESEALIVCLKDSLDINSEVSIFGIEETEGDLVFEKEGQKYIELFPVDYAIDLVDSDLELKGKGYSNEHIAKRLLDYRLNDA